VKRLFQASILIALTLLGMSVFPGVIYSTILSPLGFFIALPLLGGLLLCIAIGAARDWSHGRPFSSSFGFLSAILVVATGALVWLQVPRRIAFSISRPSFDTFIRAGEIPSENQPFEQRFGIFPTEAIRRDSRGGIYFRTHHCGDGLGPDEMSFGFAYQPNPTTSPFGAAGYRMHRVSRDWYSFSVSDDYY
jgi:hypothetical protein